MSWWIKGVQCNGFRHHFLQCHAICLILIGTTPLCLGGILRVDLTVPIVAV